ncbi:MAG: hypothetical protein ACO3AD_18770 [Burkholderiaceae bacterium]
MQNWFPTLNTALASEGLLLLWPVHLSVNYGQTISFSAGGRWISIYRDEKGRYERPVHYATLVPETYPQEYFA